MQILRSFLAAPHRYPTPSIEIQLEGKKVFLRVGDPKDWHAWRTLREVSRDFLVPWEPTWPKNAMSYNYFCGLLRGQWREWRQGKAYSFLIYKQAPGSVDKVLLGGIALSNIERGIAQRGTIGYWLGAPFTGQGYMKEALALVIAFGFQNLKLHRLEASCLPHNEPSKKILRQMGFDEEGFAKSYLQINGLWQDHILWGKTAP